MIEPSYMVQAEMTRAAFESGPDAIIVVDAGGSILAANTQAELLTGIPQARLLGEPVERLVPDGLEEVHKAHRASFLTAPYRRLMGPDLDIGILQYGDQGTTKVPVDINLAPAVISIGTIIVATIRPTGGWKGQRQR